jgi:hypothetical protein
MNQVTKTSDIFCSDPMLGWLYFGRDGGILRPEVGSHLMQLPGDSEFNTAGLERP